MRQRLSVTNQNDDNDITIDTIDNLVSQNEATLKNFLTIDEDNFTIGSSGT